MNILAILAPTCDDIHTAIRYRHRPEYRGRLASCVKDLRLLRCPTMHRLDVRVNARFCRMQRAFASQLGIVDRDAVARHTVMLVDLRRERLDDHGAVRDLHLVSFGDQGEVVADLVDDLRRELSADVGASLVAMVEGEIVGHVMLTRSLLDAPRQLVDVQVLSPVAMLPELQGQGIGSTLIRAALVIMAERSVPVVFLEGPPPLTTHASALALGRSRASANPPCASPTPPFKRFGCRPSSRGCPAHWCTRTLSGDTTRSACDRTTPPPIR